MSDPAWSTPAPPAEDRGPEPAPRRRRPRLGLIAVTLLLPVVVLVGMRTAAGPASSLPPPVLDGSAGYAFLHVDDDTGLPARFNPCEEVAYVVNPTGTSPRVVEDVHEAFRRASLATGIGFSYEGTTDELPDAARAGYQPDRYGERWAPILVAWDDIAARGGAARVMGLASNLTITHPGRQDLVLTGTLLLERAGPAMTSGFGAGRRWGNVALHEIGHLLGLDHVEERGQVMTTHVGYGAGDWGEGDLAGLAHLGREAGCLDVPPAHRTDGVVPAR